MNLKEIAVKCETVEQKNIVAKVMSEELNLRLAVFDDHIYNIILFRDEDVFMCSESFYGLKDMKIINYSDFIQHYPKYLIQSGDIVKHSYFGIMRVISFGDTLIAIGDNSKENYTLLDDYSNSIEYRDWTISSIIRPKSAMELFYIEGTTIWQRKSEIDIKREAIQLEIDKLQEELNNLGGN